MKKALVLYYTCSGNTLKVAEGTGQVLRSLGWEVRVRGLRSHVEDGNPYRPDLLFLGVPVHYWEIPSAALRMIRELPRYENTAGFVFSTFGKCVCNSVPYNLARELQAKGVAILGGAQIVMPHSARLDENTRIGDVEASFGRGEPTDETWGEYASVVKDMAARVENGGRVTGIDIDRLKRLHTRGAVAGVMNPFMNVNTMKNSMPPVRRDDERCTQCYRCVDGCDYEAMKLIDDEPCLDKNLCMRCYKCIEDCEEQALYLDWDKVIFWARFIHRFAKNPETMFVV